MDIIGSTLKLCPRCGNMTTHVLVEKSKGMLVWLCQICLKKKVLEELLKE